MPATLATAMLAAASVKHSTPQRETSMPTRSAVIGTPQAIPASTARFAAPRRHGRLRNFAES
jgi:hypothetical protein